MLDIRFAEPVRRGVLLEVVGDDDVVAVPKDVADEGVDEQFACFDVVRIFEDFGEQILFHVLHGDVGVSFLRFFVYLDVQPVQFVLQCRQSVFRKVHDDALLYGFYDIVGGAFSFFTFFDEYLQARIVAHHLFMHLDYGFRDLRDDAVPLQHRDGSIDDVIFKLLFFDCFAIAVRLPAPLGKTDVVIVYLSVSRCAAFSAHTVFAVSANELSRKYVVEDLFFAAW